MRIIARLSFLFSSNVFPLVLIALCSCNLIKDLDKTIKTVNAHDKELYEITSKMGHGAVDGAVDALTQDTAKLKKISNEIIGEIRKGGLGIVAGVRDSLLNKKTTAWLDQAFHNLSDSARLAISSIVNDPSLASGTRKIVAGIRDEILGAATQNKIATLRDSLLGPKTLKLTDTLIHHALIQVIKSYDKLEPRLGKLLDSALTTVRKAGQEIEDAGKKTLKSFLIGLGILFLASLILLYLIKRLANTHRETIEGIVNAIDGLSPENYEAVTDAIQEKLPNSINDHLDKIINKVNPPYRRFYREPIAQQALETVLRKEHSQSSIDGILKDEDIDRNIREYIEKTIKPKEL